MRLIFTVRSVTFAALLHVTAAAQPPLRADVRIHDLFEDLKDGLVLYYLVAVLSRAAVVAFPSVPTLLAAQRTPFASSLPYSPSGDASCTIFG